MNDDPLNKIEQRLKALRPAEVSDDLHDRLAARLSAKLNRPERRLRHPLMWGGGLSIAACLAYGLFLWLTPPEQSVSPVELVVIPPPALPGLEVVEVAKPSVGPPTLWVYHCALRDSPEALEAIFDNDSGNDSSQIVPSDLEERPWRVMDVCMFIHEDERCDG